MSNFVFIILNFFRTGSCQNIYIFSSINLGSNSEWEWCCCCSVAKSYLTLCYPMNCSTPGFPVLHYLPEFAQVHVHWVADAIQPSHLLLSPSPPSVFISIWIFSNESVLCIGGQSIGVSVSASVLPMNIQDWFPLQLTGCWVLQKDPLVVPWNSKTPLALKYN